MPAGAAPSASATAALITGATSGIGAAFARKLAARGHRLILTGRREEKIRAVAEELGAEHGVEVEVVLAELADVSTQEALAARVRSEPRLEYLVNNAGFGQRNDFADESFENHERMLRVHVQALMRLTHAALPAMIAANRGNIINVSSVASFIPYPGNAMYSATKAFVTNLSETLHVELAGSGIRVQALCPGVTRTDFQARLGEAPHRYRTKGLRRAMTAEEVVERSLAALARDRCLCVPGAHNLLSSVLARVVPRRIVYRLIAKALDRAL